MTARGTSRLIPVIPALFLLGCSEPPAAPTASPSQTTATPTSTAAPAPFRPVTRVYHCTGAQETITLVTRTGETGLNLFLPAATGEPHRLLTALADDGHYGADGTEVVLRERSADLILPDRRFQDCSYDPRASMWEHAKLGGADFRGLGNEPGWEMEIRGQSSLWFRYDYGAAEITVPIVETRSDPDLEQTTYIGRSDSAELVVVLTGETCADTMADDTYPTQVEVRLDGRTYQGCGRPLH